jgi:hypothetical protein
VFWKKDRQLEELLTGNTSRKKRSTERKVASWREEYWQQGLRWREEYWKEGW